MSPLFLLVPILFPIAGGVAMLPMHIRTDRARNIYAQTVVCLTSVLVWTALLSVRRGPVEIYRFTDGFGIGLQMDGLGMLFAGMISILWPFVMPYAFDYMRDARRKNGFFAFYVMTYGVTLGVAFASNMTTLYVFYEMLTLVTIPLVSHYGNEESDYAGRKYAAYTIGGASLAFFVVVMTTVCATSEHFAYGGILGTDSVTGLLQAAFLFGFFGFGVKAAVFPFHGWLPTASAAPTPVTALLHAVAVVNSGVFAVTRLVWYTYGPDVLRGTPVIRIAFCAAVFTMVYSAFYAIRVRHFKRRLAWSTVSNLSYMLTGILLMTTAGLTAGLLHMVFHSVIKMSLFLCAGAFMHVTGKSYIYDVNGVGKRMPATFGMYTLGALSLTGVPLLCGFVSKWQLVMACIAERGRMGTLGAAGLIAAAFACAIYTLSISIRAFFPMQGTDRWPDAPQTGDGEEQGGARRGSLREASFMMLVPIGFFCILNIVFGIWPQPVIDLVTRIASGLL